MLIDLYERGHAPDLLEYPGRVVVAISVRSFELSDGSSPWGRESLHGVEGVWHLLEDGPVRLDPFDVSEEYRPLYELRAGPRAARDCLYEHRWLIRYWDDDVRMPSIGVHRVVLVEHWREGGPMWTYVGPGGTVQGIQIDLPGC